MVGTSNLGSWNGHWYLPCFIPKMTRLLEDVGSLFRSAIFGDHPCFKVTWKLSDSWLAFGYISPSANLILVVVVPFTYIPKLGWVAFFCYKWKIFITSNQWNISSKLGGYHPTLVGIGTMELYDFFIQLGRSVGWNHQPVKLSYIPSGKLT